MPPFAPRRSALFVMMFIAVVAATLGRFTDARAGEWREINSRHYSVRTDINGEVADQLVERLDNIHEEYARRLSGFGDVQGNGAERAEVHLFERQADFMEFIGQTDPHVLGVFAPSVNRLALFLHNRPSLYRTLQHEAFHQFAHNSISPKMPTWLDEGLAVYFGEALWTGDRFLIGQVPPDRLKRLRADIKANRLVPFRELMGQSPEQWHAACREPQRGLLQYNQAWAMVHFLVHASNGPTAYRPHMLQMLQLLREGTPAADAFAQALSPNVEGFQARFVEFAATMQPSEDAVMFERVQVLANMLTLLRAQDVRFDTIDAMRQGVTRVGYRLEYRKGDETFQTEADPTVYFQDPAGKLLPPQRLYFAPRLHAPLPDVVCHWKDGVQFRARFFYDMNRKIEHDIVPENR